MKNKIINTENRDFIRDDKYLTFDIECYLNDNKKFIPYSCCWYNKCQYKEYYIDNFNSW